MMYPPNKSQPVRLLGPIEKREAYLIRSTEHGKDFLEVLAVSFIVGGGNQSSGEKSKRG